MSVQAMTWAWAQPCPPTSKAVLLALADHADDEGVCWPGRKGLAEKLRIHDRNITRHLSKLERMGLIRSEERLRADGSRTSNLYHLVGVIYLSPPLDESVYTPWTKSSRPLDENAETRTVIEPSLEETLPPVVPLEGEKVPQGKPTAKKKPKPSVSEGFVVKMIKDYAEVWSEKQVRETVALALSHQAAKKYDEWELYVKGWLRRDAERNPNGRQPRASPSQGAHKPQVARDPDPAWDRLRGPA